MPVTEPAGNMVVDIGGCTTGVAVISLARIELSKSVKVVVDKLDESILQYVKRNYNMLVGESTAEQVKKKLVNAIANKDIAVMQVKGRDLWSGIPMTIEMTSEEVKDAMSEPISVIIEAIKQTLERTPPELSADIVDTGIMLAGGGALLGGLDNLIKEETGLPVKIADDPLTCVVLGSGAALSQLDILKEISVS